MSQEKLAELCQVPANTIKSIEVGRLKLTPAVLRNVAAFTGARWDDEGGRWTRFDKTPFTFAYFSEHRSRKLNPSDLDRKLRKGIVRLLHSRITWLFDNVPAESWDSLWSRVGYFLEECKRDLKLTANDEVFYRPCQDSSEAPVGTHNVKQGEPKSGHTSKKPVKGSYNAAGNKKYKPKYLHGL